MKDLFISDMQDNRILKFGLIFTCLTCTVVVLQIRDILFGSVFITSLGFGVYPVIRLSRSKNIISLDYIYLISVFASLGGVLAYPSTIPIGFSDVHAHLAIIELYLSSNKILPFNLAPSFNFIGYYVYIVLLSKILSAKMIKVAQYLPIPLLIITVLVYHTIVCGEYLLSKLQLLAALMFGLQYGVFRFSSEFRTLNLALPLAVLLFALNFHPERYSSSTTKFLNITYTRTRIIGLVVVSSFATIHFSSIILMILILSIITLVSWFNNSRSVSSFYLAVCSGSLFIYSVFLGGGFNHAVFTIYSGSLEPLFFGQDATGWDGSAVNATNGSKSGVNNVGEGTYMITWLLRFNFVIAAGALSIKWLLHNRDNDTLILFAISAIFGLLALLSTIGIELILNPGRLMTFFAIPYGLIFAAGVGICHDKIPTSKTSLCHIGIFILCGLIIISPLTPMPLGIIGSIESVQESSGPNPQYELNKQDSHARDFARNSVKSDFSYGPNIGEDYYDVWLETVNPEYHISIRDCKPKIYSNGKLNFCRI